VIVSRRVKLACHVARMGEIINAQRILTGKGSPWRKWNDIRIHLRELGLEGVNWINLAQDRNQSRSLQNTVMNLRVPKRG